MLRGDKIRKIVRDWIQTQKGNSYLKRLNIHFNSKIRLEFHGIRLTSDGGLLAYQELDEAFGLFDLVPTAIFDSRNGRNIQHDMTNLLRQSVSSRLAGYEDVNDAHRLSVDPVMRAVRRKKARFVIIQQFLREMDGQVSLLLGFVKENCKDQRK